MSTYTSGSRSAPALPSTDYPRGLILCDGPHGNFVLSAKSLREAKQRQLERHRLLCATFVADRDMSAARVQSPRA